MLTIGILAAMSEELEPFISLGVGEKTAELLLRQPVYLHDANYPQAGQADLAVRFVLSLCGVGKVRAAAATQAFIDRYQPDLILNIGTAGGLRADIAVGDIVVTRRQHEHDSQLWERSACDSHQGVAEYIYRELSALGRQRVHIGNGCAGDMFQSEYEAKQHLAQQFDAYCVDMESAAIAHVCSLNDVPFCVVRTISDALEGNLDEFEQHYERVSQEVAEALVPLLGGLVCRFGEEANCKG